MEQSYLFLSPLGLNYGWATTPHPHPKGHYAHHPKKLSSHSPHPPFTPLHPKHPIEVPTTLLPLIHPPS